jgi:hypothetical protein
MSIAINNKIDVRASKEFEDVVRSSEKLLTDVVNISDDNLRLKRFEFLQAAIKNATARFCVMPYTEIEKTGEDAYRFETYRLRVADIYIEESMVEHNQLKYTVYIEHQTSAGIDNPPEYEQYNVAEYVTYPSIISFAAGKAIEHAVNAFVEMVRENIAMEAMFNDAMKDIGS